MASFREVEHILFKNRSFGEIENLRKTATKYIRLYSKVIRNADLYIRPLRKLQTHIGHLKLFLAVLFNLNTIWRGVKRNNRVNVTPIFRGRIRTGVVINLKHKKKPNTIFKT